MELTLLEAPVSLLYEINVSLAYTRISLIPIRLSLVKLASSLPLISVVIKGTGKDKNILTYSLLYVLRSLAVNRRVLGLINGNIRYRKIELDSYIL